jgi:hypothetical protein
MNIGMVVMHWFLSAGVNKWIKEAPLPSKEAAAPVKEACPVCEEGSDDFDACEEKRVACETPVAADDAATF